METEKLKALSVLYLQAKNAADFDEFLTLVRNKTYTEAFNCPRCASRKIRTFILGFVHVCNDCEFDF